MTVPPEFVPPPPTVGLAVSKVDIDSNSGILSRQIEVWAGQVLNFKEYLDAATDEMLTAPPFGYSEDNIAVLKSAFNDLSLLARIYQGDDVLAEARDLGAFSRRLAGLVL